MLWALDTLTMGSKTNGKWQLLAFLTFVDCGLETAAFPFTVKTQNRVLVAWLLGLA